MHNGLRHKEHLFLPSNLPENMFIALERLRSGIANSLELRETQQSYEQTLVRQTEALFQMKLSELNLLYLKGELIIQE